MMSLMLKGDSEYRDMPLMEFYLLLKESEKNFQLSGFRTGSIKSFYENTSYLDLALCVNIVEDISSHITIHKAKGAEYENVFVVGNESLLEFLRTPNIEENEEHRVFYVALSRAKKRLFLYLDKLSFTDENLSEKSMLLKLREWDNDTIIMFLFILYLSQHM